MHDRVELTCAFICILYECIHVCVCVDVFPYILWMESEVATEGLLGILSPLLKFAIEALFRSRYSNMELPSSLS